MNYREALAWLYGTQTFGIKLGLDNPRRLLAALGDPQQGLRFLHVAGTNGKGSTCAMLAAMLRADGQRAGLYTSPHLVDFRERIRLDGQMIPESDVAQGLTRLREVTAGWEYAPTFFELATALAAWWFARQKADIVVWETGMGGRLDATNVVTPLVSVITPVGLDHQEWLGPTLADIATEKAGIIKPRVPVVSAPQCSEVRAALMSRALASGSTVQFVAHPWSDGGLALPGEHQRWNAALACAALDAADLVPDGEVRRRGLAAVEWEGRFQRVGEKLILDGAHNPPAIEALVQAWREVFGDKKARLIFGAMRDKEVGALLRGLRAISGEICLVPVANPRSCPVDELRSLAKAAGYVSLSAASVEEALGAAREADATTLLTGSLFLVGEVLASLGGRGQPHRSAQ